MTTHDARTIPPFLQDNEDDDALDWLDLAAARLAGVRAGPWYFDAAASIAEAFTANERDFITYAALEVAGLLAEVRRLNALLERAGVPS